MLYKKNPAPALSMELFQNPTSEYRGAPFWAWNCELEPTELMRQIECLKEMGFGGFHIHSRSGMATEYLSEEFMQLVKDCTEKAKKEDMLTWLYDEDRWPSGSAGGLVTKTPAFRQRNLVFTTKPISGVEEKEAAIQNGGTYLLGVYDIILNKRGELEFYRLLKENESAAGTLRFAYVAVKPPYPPGWYNGESYVDTLNPAAIEKFVAITHEKYKKAVGADFGNAVPAIFTDEPQFSHKQTLSFAESTEDVTLPWTPDFDETYRAAYGIDIVEHLPELFWELPNGNVSVARYCYHDHICERFNMAFSDTCGAWCHKNGIYLTGHMMEESTLRRQTAAIGEAMRAYRSFELPGIDMLCDYKEYATAKQAQSAAHQYGREGVMSELYGVTNWDFDFRGHKSQGDWQAALGVTVRVPHLSWMSMKGPAKRDYPASINYQSPWYKEYPYIEDHFARLNTVLTRGKPCVSVGVIHPIESYWLHWGPSENTFGIREQMDWNFESIISWLLFGTIDFDFISEACLPSLCGEISETLAVGEMRYRAVVVPACETLRKTTVDILNKLIDRGGRVIFAGAAPKYIDAVPSADAQKIYDRAVCVPFDRQAILNALESERMIEIKDNQGNSPAQFIHQLRKDGNDYRLFIANSHPAANAHAVNSQPPISALIKIRGEYTPTLMDTISGELKKIDFVVKNGFTTLYYTFHAQDSLLVSLAPCVERSYTAPRHEPKEISVIDFKHKLAFSREEDNVCLLDLAEYAVDDGDMKSAEEILRMDRNLRKELGWQPADGRDVQPWAIEKEVISHFVTLCFRFNSEIALDGTCFCAEELASLRLNGTEVALCERGYFVDKSIRKYALPRLAVGENVIMAKVPFGKRISLEACYLTGDFGVRLEGCQKTLTAPADSITFGDIVHQGMPFYGGNLTYRATIHVPESCDLRVNIAKYSGALTRVTLDGEDKGAVVFAPYELEIKDVSAGEHTIAFTLFGNRYNTFGALHNCSCNTWYGPSYWYSADDSWCYEYNTKATGILKSPVMKLLKK